MPYGPVKAKDLSAILENVSNLRPKAGDFHQLRLFVRGLSMKLAFVAVE